MQFQEKLRGVFNGFRGISGYFKWIQMVPGHLFLEFGVKMGFRSMYHESFRAVVVLTAPEAHSCPLLMLLKTSANLAKIKTRSQLSTKQFKRSKGKVLVKLKLYDI